MPRKKLFKFIIVFFRDTDTCDWNVVSIQETMGILKKPVHDQLREVSQSNT